MAIAYVFQWIFQPASDLRIWCLILSPAAFWSVWRLETLPCPRCGTRFINLLQQSVWLEDPRCKHCGLVAGATGDAT